MINKKEKGDNYSYSVCRSSWAKCVWSYGDETVCRRITARLKDIAVIQVHQYMRFNQNSDSNKGGTQYGCHIFDL